MAYRRLYGLQLLRLFKVRLKVKLRTALVKMPFYGIILPLVLTLTALIPDF